MTILHISVQHDSLQCGSKNIDEIVEPSLKARVTPVIYGLGFSFAKIILFSVFVSLTGLLLHLSKLLFCSAYLKHYRKT